MYVYIYTYLHIYTYISQSPMVWLFSFFSGQVPLRPLLAGEDPLGHPVLGAGCGGGALVHVAEMVGYKNDV